MPEPGLKSQFSLFSVSTFSPQPLSHNGSHSSPLQSGDYHTSLPTHQVFLEALHREQMKQVRPHRITAGPVPAGCNPQALELSPQAPPPHPTPCLPGELGEPSLLFVSLTCFCLTEQQNLENTHFTDTYSPWIPGLGFIQLTCQSGNTHAAMARARVRNRGTCKPPSLPLFPFLAKWIQPDSVSWCPSVHLSGTCILKRKWGNTCPQSYGRLLVRYQLLRSCGQEGDSGVSASAHMVSHLLPNARGLPNGHWPP